MKWTASRAGAFGLAAYLWGWFLRGAADRKAEKKVSV